MKAERNGKFSLEFESQEVASDALRRLQWHDRVVQALDILLSKYESFLILDGVNPEGLPEVVEAYAALRGARRRG